MKKLVLVLVTVGLLICSCSLNVNAEETDEGDDLYVTSSTEKSDNNSESDATLVDEVVAATDFESVEKLTPGVIIEGYPCEGLVIPFAATEDYDRTQPHLTKQSGIFYGPSGKETYYNLPMGNVINYMRSLGYTTEEYPYWVRDDGAKMLGSYVMIAANTYAYPKGTVMDTSLGKGLVCDKCVAAIYGDVSVDIAVTW